MHTEAQKAVFETALNTLNDAVKQVESFTQYDLTKGNCEAAFLAVTEQANEDNIGLLIVIESPEETNTVYVEGYAGDEVEARIDADDVNSMVELIEQSIIVIDGTANMNAEETIKAYKQAQLKWQTATDAEEE